MQVHRFDPFTVLARMDREFDELVRRGWASAGEGSGKPATRRMAAGFVPAVEVARDGEDVVVRVELPGIDVEKDVSIEVELGKLVISGERRDTRADDQDGVLVRELRYGQFRREFALPPGVSPEHVEASYDAGLLDVRLRSVVAPEPEPVKVPITTGRRQVVEHAPAQAVGAGESSSSSSKE
jgi:HSP20 family protein